MLSLNGDDENSGALAGVQAALDEINSSWDNLLPRYTLHYTLTDSKGESYACMHEKNLKMRVKCDFINLLVHVIGQLHWMCFCTAASSSHPKSCFDRSRLFSCHGCHNWNIFLIQHSPGNKFWSINCWLLNYIDILHIHLEQSQKAINLILAAAIWGQPCQYFLQHHQGVWLEEGGTHCAEWTLIATRQWESEYFLYRQ